MPCLCTATYYMYILAFDCTGLRLGGVEVCNSTSVFDTLDAQRVEPYNQPNISLMEHLETLQTY